MLCDPPSAALLPAPPPAQTLLGQHSRLRPPRALTGKEWILRMRNFLLRIEGDNEGMNEVGGGGDEMRPPSPWVTPMGGTATLTL